MRFIRGFTAQDGQKKKVGFTLAEVLITLGILGVIAAILIPAITSIAPDRNKVMLRKAYVILQQAVSRMINDDTNYPGDYTTQVNGYVFQRGFDYTDATSNGTTNKFCYFLAENLKTIGDVTCPVDGASAGGYKFADTTDGMTWFIWTQGLPAYMFPVGNYYWTTVIVDVNGQNNGPNCTDQNTSFINGYQCNKVACKNPDTFFFGIRYDGKIQLGSYEGSDTYMQNVLSNPTDNKR